jgi:hypothetical protein
MHTYNSILKQGNQVQEETGLCGKTLSQKRKEINEKQSCWKCFYGPIVPEVGLCSFTKPAQSIH